LRSLPGEQQEYLTMLKQTQGNSPPSFCHTII
jgi:hypothetical protein